MRIVAILNQKGGVGKTTTAVNLGAALAHAGSVDAGVRGALAGRRVLLVDCDPQANLTDHLGLDESVGELTVYDVLTEGVPIEGAVLPTSTPGLSVLPADGDLAAVEQELATEIARETRLRRALARVPADTYDWVLIDCPPSLGLLSLNAMTAATGMIVTVQTEYFAMRGLSQIDDIVRMVQEHVNPRLQLLGILPTLVNPVTRLAREVMEEVRGHYGPLVFDTRIRQNIRLAEAPGHQSHIFDYDPLSAGAEDYRALAVELEARVAAAAVPVQAVPAKAGPAQAVPVQAVPAKAGPAQAGPAQAVPAQAGPAQAGPAQAGPTVAKPAPIPIAPSAPLAPSPAAVEPEAPAETPAPIESRDE